MTDDEQKVNLAEVNNEWKKYQVVLYTPTIEAGLDFNMEEHFNRMYCFLNSGSCCPRAFLQMIGRVRSLVDNNIRCYYDKCMSYMDKTVYIPTIDEFEDYVLDNVKMNYSLIIDNGTVNKIVKKDAFTRVFAFNYYEQYNSSVKFLKILKEILSEKNYSYMNEEIEEIENEIQEENSEEKSENKNKTATNSSLQEEPVINIAEQAISVVSSSKKSIYELDELMLAPHIDAAKAKELETKKNTNIATREDKLALKRYFMEKKFKLKPEEFTLEFLLSWYNKEYILDNVLYAVGKKNDDNKNDCLANMRQKKGYLESILDVFGFNDLLDFDKFVIKDDNLEKKMKDSKLIEKDNYEKMMKCFGKRLRCNQNKYSTSTFINVIDSVLNDFGVKLNIKRKQTKQNKIQKWSYTYNLIENINNLKIIVERYK